jgi:hypothetical protein
MRATDPGSLSACGKVFNTCATFLAVSRAGVEYAGASGSASLPDLFIRRTVEILILAARMALRCIRRNPWPMQKDRGRRTGFFEFSGLN